MLSLSSASANKLKRKLGPFEEQSGNKTGKTSHTPPKQPRVVDGKNGDKAQQLVGKQHPPIPTSTRRHQYATNAMRTKSRGIQPGARVGPSIREQVAAQVSSSPGHESLRSAADTKNDFSRTLGAVNYTQSRVNKNVLEEMNAPGKRRDPRWLHFAQSQDQKLDPRAQEAFELGMQNAAIIHRAALGSIHDKHLNDLLTAVENTCKSQADLALLLTKEGATPEQIDAANKVLNHVQPTLQRAAPVGALEQDESRSMLGTTLGSLPGQVLVQPFVRFKDLSARFNDLQNRIAAGRAGLKDPGEYDDALENRLLIACAQEIIHNYKLGIEKWELTSQAFRDPAVLQQVPGEAREILKIYSERLRHLSRCAQAAGSPFTELLAQAQKVVSPVEPQTSTLHSVASTTSNADGASGTAANSLVESAGLQAQPIKPRRINRVLPPPTIHSPSKNLSLNASSAAA